MKVLRYFAVLPALALAAVAFAPAANAQPATPNNQQQRAINIGGLIDAIVQVEANLENVLTNILNDSDVRVVNVEDSLNGNQVNVLSDILNNSKVLSENVVTVQNILNNSLNNNEVLNDFLNNNDVNVEDVIAIDVLENGDVVIFVLS